MKAWLITWDWSGDHAKMPYRIVDILSARTSLRDVRIHTERLYARERYGWAERLAFARYRNNDRLYPDSRLTRANSGRMHIDCGHNPFLWARIVDNIKVVIGPDGKETLAWDEI